MSHDNDMLGELADLETVTTDTEEKPKPTEATDTEAETAKADTAETDAAPETSPELETLKKHGLDGQFKTTEEALAAIRFKDKQIEEQRRREAQFFDNLRARREEQLATSEKKEEVVTPSRDELLEKLNTDPEAAIEDVLRRRGYVKRDELKPIEGQVNSLSRRTAQDAAERMFETMPELKEVAPILVSGGIPNPGQNKMFDAIEAELVKDPVINRAYNEGRMNNMEVISHFYRIIRERTPSNGTRPKTEITPVSAAEKAAAKTSGGGGRTQGVKKTLDNISADDIEKMSLRDTEKLLYEAGQLSRENLMAYVPTD